MHLFIYTCDNCCDEIRIYEENFYGECNICSNGHYQPSGEEYDQEFLDQQQYEREQDREYEERHRSDGRY